MVFCLNPAKTVPFPHNPTSPDLPGSVQITSYWLSAQAISARNVSSVRLPVQGDHARLVRTRPVQLSPREVSSPLPNAPSLQDKAQNYLSILKSRCNLPKPLLLSTLLNSLEQCLNLFVNSEDADATVMTHLWTSLILNNPDGLRHMPAPLEPPSPPVPITADSDASLANSGASMSPTVRPTVLEEFP
ncbi:hypothetical protein H2248_012248 [Termitomyces sp. 'cryptogamus']|nr:hypothetical protein H2248_012248 [Termitomyces sp. 'cryptogamus']